MILILRTLTLTVMVTLALSACASMTDSRCVTVAHVHKIDHNGFDSLALRKLSVKEFSEWSRGRRLIKCNFPSGNIPADAYRFTVLIDESSGEYAINKEGGFSYVNEFYGVSNTQKISSTED